MPRRSAKSEKLSPEFVGWFAFISLAIVIYVLIQRFRNPKKKNQASLAGTVQKQAAKKSVKSYTAKEVAQHATRDDCWIILDNKVYDVTSYVDEHPGGDAILNHAGADSTEGFHGPQHPTRVFDIIEDFYIGNLVETSKDK
ncbi:hypothetical protein CYMTET_14472 [Cymbomonas tetramitiformis]|uniref:Cytochrome b5 heme-binding domain-containing protein n=1 Tax=Cymbomonas tetramitiformis TaxID=36881 RepID=A0AAE0GG98_9CHLO|nr:hypothetical protein CYMTET_14472 [Cymbomonas tetramitiformis]